MRTTTTFTPGRAISLVPAREEGGYTLPSVGGLECAQALATAILSPLTNLSKLV